MVGKTYRVDVSKLTRETALMDLSTRSIILAGLVSLIREETGVSISIPEASACKTIGGLIDYLENK